MFLQKVVFIVGPTAVGKTEVACLLAKDLKSEIVSCDAMQVYKEVCILTGKPPASILKKTKHHLIDIISVQEDFDVFMFYQKTRKVIAALCRKGKIPIVVGGSGLYMSILLDGIFEQKAKPDLKVRQKIQKAIEEKGTAWAFEKIQTIDPKAASKIHPHDARRLARVLEVFETCGKPISQLHHNRQGLWGVHDIRIFALTRPRPELYERINARVEDMFSQGAVGEIKALGFKKLSRTAQGIIGLNEIRDLLKGSITETQAKELIKRNTRRFAKRQMTWFRKDQRLEWIDMPAPTSARQIANQIAFLLKKERKS